MLRRIFISHKVKDRVAAERIRSTLKVYGAKSLEIFVSERIKPGEKWTEQVM